MGSAICTPHALTTADVTDLRRASEKINQSLKTICSTGQLADSEWLANIYVHLISTNALLKRMLAQRASDTSNRIKRLGADGSLRPHILKVWLALVTLSGSTGA